MKCDKTILALLVIGCGKSSPTGPPPPPPTNSVSLRATLQDSILFVPPWRPDSMYVAVGGKVTRARAGEQGNCVVWDSLPDNRELRWVLFVSDTVSAQVDSLWTNTYNFPTPDVRHAFASVEEYQGPGRGAFAVIRSVSGECSLTVGG